MSDRLEEYFPSGQPRCQARKSYGSVWKAWVAGREQCSRKAMDGDVFCGIHRAQSDRRIANRNAS